ncbi:hypothetical protein HYC85_008249 [Camellia sinensis]|uniref:Sieve element occlusion C-terminal domain-containing protein n=1 Tax=Camellia sinensis TaxID=4442 RepID=A0A7J7HRB3_CAMSI|nr:hypothetical protein HYC85_008249 [Camellia sinensis]
MALIGGAMAFPFSTSRENELWEEETWNLQLLLDGIDPLVAKWVEEDQNLCIYGSNNIDWIREFNAKMRNMTSAGLQLKMVYVGKKNSSDDHMKNILATMYEEKLTNTNDESEKGWVLLGKGSSTETLKLQGRKIMECLDLFPMWGENVAMLGLVGAITTAIEPPLLVEPCSHSNIIQFVEGLKDTIICDKCKCLLEKFVVYKCSTQLKISPGERASRGRKKRKERESRGELNLQLGVEELKGENQDYSSRQVLHKQSPELHVRGSQLHVRNTQLHVQGLTAARAALTTACAENRASKLNILK